MLSQLQGFLDIALLAFFVIIFYKYLSYPDKLPCKNFRTNSLKRIKNAKWQVKDCPPELLLGDISRRLSTEVTPAAIAQNNRTFVEKLLKVGLILSSYQRYINIVIFIIILSILHTYCS